MKWTESHISIYVCLTTCRSPTSYFKIRNIGNQKVSRVSLILGRFAKFSEGKNSLLADSRKFMFANFLHEDENFLLADLAKFIFANFF